MSYSHEDIERTERVIVQYAGAEAGRKLASLYFQAFCLVALSLGLFVCVAIEFAVIYTVLDGLSGPEVPGEGDPWHVLLLSLSGIMMVLAYHLLTKRYGKVGVLGWLEQASRILVPFYFIGIIALFIFLNITDAREFWDVASDGETFSWNSIDPHGGEQKESGPINFIFDHVSPYLVVLFAVFFSAIGIVTLSVADVLLDHIARYTKLISETSVAAPAQKQAVRDFKKAQSEIAKVKQAIAKLDDQSISDRLDEAAAVIAMTIEEPKRELESWVSQASLFNKEENVPDILQPQNHPRLRPDEFKAYLEKLRALDMKHIREIIGAPNNQEVNDA